MSGERSDLEWFRRHSDVQDPKSFINVDPAYFAKECAAALPGLIDRLERAESAMRADVTVIERLKLGKQG
jgi:hypothetical protein